MKTTYKFALCLLLALLICLSIAHSAWAMASSNYRLNWFTPLTSSGGGPAASANYQANFTIGQAAIGVSTSVAGGALTLGYWQAPERLYLPTVQR